jgi:betaine-aldehyde dehydrogenase
LITFTPTPRYFTESLNLTRRVSRGVEAGTVWTNAWAALNDGFPEGG